MKDRRKIKLFLVDDDVLFLKSLEIDFFTHSNFLIETYATGELCMENISHKPDIIILDYDLDGSDEKAMDGIQTLDKIKLVYHDMPVVILSSQDRIEVAVNCIQHKAYDYVIKSETAFVRLFKNIQTIFTLKEIERGLNLYGDWM
jgi:DNA-binding NtrC family response regulator